MKFQQTSNSIQSGISNHLQSGVQIYVSQNFRRVMNFSVGENSPGQRLSTRTRMLWLSAGKPILAVAVLQKVEKGKLRLDQKLVEFLPELTGPGTELISIQDCLTHTAGLKPISTGYPHQSWEKIIQNICAAGLRKDQSIGANVGYDPGRTWFLLAEILQRIDGRQIADIVRQDIFEPIGMNNTWMAMPSEEYDSHPELMGITYTSKAGVLSPTPNHQKEIAILPAPGASNRGPISELGAFYEMLLRNGTSSSGVSILTPESVHQMTQRLRKNKMDHSFQRIVDFGLGVIINSRQYGGGPVPYGFGEYASDDTFGHGGSQCSIGFADPKNQIVVTAIANGMPGDQQHNIRFHDLLSAIYTDLGIA